MMCFWFSDSGHEFEELIRVGIFFLLVFLFYYLTLFILKNELHDVLQFLFYQVIMIS